MSPTSSSLHRLISEQLFPLSEHFSADADLYQAGLDSMALMQLILSLELEFDLRLEPSDLGRENFQSLQAIEQLIYKKQTS